MKHTILFLLLCSLALLWTGCAEEEAPTRTCVKCGNPATTTLSGPAEILQSYGISLADCVEITSNIYSVYVCDSCVGPVAEDPLLKDSGWY